MTLLLVTVPPSLSAIPHKLPDRDRLLAVDRRHTYIMVVTSRVDDLQASGLGLPTEVLMHELVQDEGVAVGRLRY